ncbi:CDP-6-deoxy-delta-3,4-glucoseen reductase [Herbaspirillum seropedicae]|uniref:CDP-6-deoxy-delta-3,4-glucoseen reductase n=1 Tax=Herbaspirillum seropedicae TaxID=964 RepID=UPI0031DDFC72
MTATAPHEAGFSITVEPSGRNFVVQGDETILAAGIRQGIGLPYGCKDGACGSCKCKKLSGEVTLGPHQSKALSAEEQLAGFVLTCCARARSDVVLESRQVTDESAYPIKKMPVRVAALEKKADDVIVLSLQLPANDRLQYKAGQYVEFLLRDGKRRSYSMATAPHKDEHMSLHIRHLPGGLFTDQVFTTLKERDILRIEGPLGTFFLREDSDKPIILLASGTGFAPIKAIVEQLEHAGSKRPVTLYWGGRRPQDLYMDALCQQWEQTLPNFKYEPVVSNAQAEDNWSGRTGFVHRAVMEDFPDLSGHQVYACGAPIVVESAQRDFSAQCGLPQDEFYADSFTSEADLAKPVADSPAA